MNGTKELKEGQYIIIDVINKDIFKDKHNNILHYNTEEEAMNICGIYEFNNAWIVKLIYNQKEE